MNNAIGLGNVAWVLINASERMQVPSSIAVPFSKRVVIHLHPLFLMTN
jgi:hypothetical protein